MKLDLNQPNIRNSNGSSQIVSFHRFDPKCVQVSILLKTVQSGDAVYNKACVFQCGVVASQMFTDPRTCLRNAQRLPVCLYTPQSYQTLFTFLVYTTVCLLHLQFVGD